MTEYDDPSKLQKYKRRNLRRPLIVLRARIDTGPKSFFGYAKNISRGGMFIASVNPQQPGSRFRVEFPLPPSTRTTVTCECEVVWQRQFNPSGRLEPGMGLKFIDMPDAQAEEIDDWAKSTD